MPSLLQDIRHGLRLLLRAPAFTTVVILAVALGIGANTAVFSVLNAVLLKPLPYPDPDRIVSVDMRFTGIGLPDDRNWTSPPELADLQRFSNAYSAVAAYTNTSFNMRRGELPERFLGARVTGQFFEVMGVEPALGRTFAPGEDEPGAEAVAVLGNTVWRNRFNADPSIAGQDINLNGLPTRVIGVMPAGFAFPADVGIWTPLAFTAGDLSANMRGSHFLRTVARIKPGLSLPQARADMEGVSARIIDNAPDYHYPEVGFAVLIRPLLEAAVGDIRPALLLLMGAVGLVLLIACANVANLLMVRASARFRELGIRAALGAGRARLVRQLLTESVLLSCVGAVCGTALAYFAVRAIAGFGAQAFPRLASVALDTPTLLFTVTVAVLTGLVFGIAPAFQASQPDSHEALKESGRSLSSGPRGLIARRLMVGAEIALSLALVTGAGLLIKSFVRLQEVDPGFRAENVMTLRAVLPELRYSDPASIRRFYDDLLARVRSIPGVESAGAINALPLSGSGGSGTTTMDATSVPADQASPEADRRVVTPGYFETMGTALRSGRYFEERDNQDAPLVAIVDETLAETYWPGENPLGKRLKFGGSQSPNPWRTIVGVVQHTRYLSLEQPSRVEVYVPASQTPLSGMSLAIKTAGATASGAASIAEAVQREVIGIDPEQPIYSIQPMEQLMADAVRRRQLILILLSAFAGIALILASLGIYGVMSYWVQQRSQEIGIRLALGATRGDILRMVLGQSSLVVAGGIAAGIAAALSLTRLLSSLLFNVAPTDIVTLGAVTVGMGAIGLLASAIPAVRALRLDPVRALHR